MKTVLAALNAKYIHTGLGARTVAAYARSRGMDKITLWERTINHRPRLLLRELAEQAADVMVFSCYIWNMELVRALAADLRRIDPRLVLVAAGPEISYHSEDFLAGNPAFDYVVAGEGEEATVGLLRALETGDAPAAPAVVRGAPMELDALSFPYPDLAALDGRIFYYESMRGCPFRCSYCLSSIEGGPVRFRSLPRVFADLRRFLDAGAGQVKFVDRTFNCDRERARAIWGWLRDNDNGVTGFHFELAGELLDGETAALLATLRPGQVQFEIGVQSVNPDTLEAIHRPADTDRLFAMVQTIRRPRNIHLHLDLIAGLPYEDYRSFARSFDVVYAQGPDQLQPGFLKVLRGSAMERDALRYGIVHQAHAPYEVLRTRWLTFGELARLQGVADMVELYYNSGRFAHLIADLVAEYGSPFGFYEALWAHYSGQGHDASPPGKVGYYEILGGFLAARGLPASQRRQWLCRYDMALHEKIKKAPAWVSVDGFTPHRARILDFLSRDNNLERFFPGYAGREPKQVVKMAHAEIFPFRPDTGESGECLALFDYTRRDIAGRAIVSWVQV